MATLNQGQRQVYNDIVSFLCDPTRKEHRVAGGPGTGKSFLISKIASDILKIVKGKADLDHIEVTATTNQAAAVLQQAIPEMEDSIKTIYSALNLRLSENWKTGETKIMRTKVWAVHDRTLFIIDEASMVNTTLMEELHAATTSKCKILYVGDKNQLNPVKESISPVYSKHMSESLLTEPVRNAEQPALVELVDQAKKTVETGEFFKIKPVPGVIDLVDGPALKGVLERNYHSEDATKRILGYTNDTVIAYNEFCRELRGYEEPLVQGEIVVNNEAAEITPSLRLYTGQMLEIVEKRGSYWEDFGTAKSYLVYDLLVKDIHTSVPFEFRSFANPMERSALLKEFARVKRWERYFTIKNKHPDLRPIAASTTHKAQGSTYNEVVVDLSDISTSTNRDMTARMLYVALSRPRNRIYVRGELDERYYQ